MKVISHSSYKSNTFFSNKQEKSYFFSYLNIIFSYSILNEM